MQTEAKKKIRRGWSKAKCYEWLQENYGITAAYARKVLNAAYEAIVADNEKCADKIAAIQLERVEEILKECMESNDRAQALKAIDIINKMFCLYIEKQDINVHSDVIRFEFDAPENQQPNE